MTCKHCGLKHSGNRPSDCIEALKKVNQELKTKYYKSMATIRRLNVEQQSKVAA
jgi:hypothetical protein